MNITVRDVPKALHDRLRATARESGRSVNRLILATLEKSLLPTRHRHEDLLARIRQRRELLPVRLSLKDVQAAVDEGRP